LRGIVLSEYRGAAIDARRAMHYLARLRFGEAKLTSHSVDSAWAAKLSFTEAQLAIFFAKLFADLLF